MRLLLGAVKDLFDAGCELLAMLVLFSAHVLRILTCGIIRTMEYR